ncbi:hypothetical protein [Streptomyces sp. NRRL F-2580]|uniref:hypothetical protein n=1 Tax=Streptomyces sp. NRRL F-2580 TaxID=1463841 RepID=UPI0004CB43EE|nr:hypothetical protein [Streptomyces sp. NRRL F-2580]
MEIDAGSDAVCAAGRPQPAIDRTLRGAARIDAAITANVRLVRSRPGAEPELAARVAAGRLSVVGARYELTSQRVRGIR